MHEETQVLERGNRILMGLRLTWKLHIVLEIVAEIAWSSSPLQFNSQARKCPLVRRELDKLIKGSNAPLRRLGVLGSQHDHCSACGSKRGPEIIR